MAVKGTKATKEINPISSNGNINKFVVVLTLLTYAGNALTKATALYIRMMAQFRSGIKFGGEDAAKARMLKKFDVSQSEFEALGKSVHFYTNGDGQIVIPGRQVRGWLKECVTLTKEAKVHKSLKDKIGRLIIVPEDIPTSFTLGDIEAFGPVGIFGRPVFLRSSSATGSSGSRESGRWDYTEGPVIPEPFEASFELVSLDFEPEELYRLVMEASKVASIGGCRKLGYGRLQVKKFWKVPLKAEELLDLENPEVEQNIIPVVAVEQNVELPAAAG